MEGLGEVMPRVKGVLAPACIIGGRICTIFSLEVLYQREDSLRVYSSSEFVFDGNCVLRRFCQRLKIIGVTRPIFIEDKSLVWIDVPYRFYELYFG